VAAALVNESLARWWWFFDSNETIDLHQDATTSASSSSFVTNFQNTKTRGCKVSLAQKDAQGSI
jgi:hypothetical protein